MRANAVKRTLRSGGVALGTMLFDFASPGITRLASGAGADFILMDMEHTGWSVETIRALLATCPPTLASFVRVPATEYHFLARVLDVGAQGLMVPMVESAEQARKIVASAKYPPVGRRGTAFGMAHDDFQAGDVRQSMQQANDELLLIAQIETATGLANIEEIAAIEEIDVLWIGHFDLTTSLGIPGEFSHPRYLEAVKKVVETCGATGKVAGFMAGTVETGQELLRQGFRIVAYSRDTALYQQALATGLNTLRSFQRDNLK